MNSVGGRIIGIVVCGALGALAGFFFVLLIVLEGVLGALVAVMIAAVVASAAFAGWTTVGRVLERPK